MAVADPQTKRSDGTNVFPAKVLKSAKVCGFLKRPANPRKQETIIECRITKMEAKIQKTIIKIQNSKPFLPTDCGFYLNFHNHGVLPAQHLTHNRLSGRTT